MAANKIIKLSMVSDFKRHPYQNSGMSMQVSSLPTNSSLQNTPRNQISLKLETNNNLPILLAAILETVHRKNGLECNFHHYQSIPHFKITLDINFH
jgi:hypothetical protein